MCSVAGGVGVEIGFKTKQRMLKTMACRGPDDEGWFQNGSCTLLHTRLAVVDIEGGMQPMTLEHGAERYTMVYNGELYNTMELRNLLRSLGHRFKTSSDTEVVLHAYAQWQEGCLERFNGIFAFAVWEHKRKKLFLARDRIGVKPLFYTLRQGGILFGSEIKTLLSHDDVKAELDTLGIMQLIMLGPGRLPGSGVLKGIFELEPGCFGYFYCGKWSWKRYWKLRDAEHTDSFEQTAEKVRYIVTDSIKRQMVSDVPLGTFLSGGLDSSLISSVCARVNRDKGAPLDTFSVDYENNERYFAPGKFQPNADGEYICIMVDELGSHHHSFVYTPEQLSDALDEAVQARDLPGMADVDSSLLLLCKDIRRHVKVALSGECADELFGGYPWYRDPDVRALDGFPWAQNTKERARFLHPETIGKQDPHSFVMDAYRDTVNKADILPGTTPEEKRMKEMVNLNFRWFMQTLLDRKDRMSMRCGLEVRVPFCDYRIAEYLYTVPWKYKDYNGVEKGLLRYAMAEYLPNSVLYRKKSPYPKTHDPKYMQLMLERLKEIINDKQAPIHGVVNFDVLRSLVGAEFSWPWYGQLMREPQTIAYMLQLNHWLKHYGVSIVS